MADTGFQLVLDGLAEVIGGTVSSVDSHYYSGDLAGDGSGIAGLKGCWSVKPDDIQTTPVAVLIPDSFDDGDPLQGQQDLTDWVTLVVYVSRFDAKAQGALLNSFRDLVPTAIHAHMQAFATVNVDVHAATGRTVVREFGGITYLAWDFRIRLRRVAHDILIA